MIRGDWFAANRIMGAQALGFCGNARLAFENILKACTNAKNGYLLFQGLNAFHCPIFDLY
jgi:hypothetical protein